MAVKMLAECRVLPGGCRVQLSESDSGPGTRSLDRFGFGYEQKSQVRIRVRKVVPVQNSTFLSKTKIAV
jgi:hypothetical protein